MGEAVVNTNSAMTGLKPLNSLFTSLPTTIFETMSKLAVQHKSVNLGQGFPDDTLEGPESMKAIVGGAVYEHTNQYPSLMGLPELRQALSRHDKKFYGFDVDWATEVVVTVGATEALASVFLGLLNTGDEVVVFDPLYDSYVSMCRRVDAKLVPVKLQLPDLNFNREELAAAFSPRTKFILINTPHNPTGKIFTRAELEFIADLCKKHNTYAVLDEVYEHLAFEGYEHVSLRQFDDMQERCVRIGSAGKTFSFTAWKVGWAIGPPPIIAAIAKAHQFLVFTVPSNMQRAVAFGLDNEQGFYRSLGQQFQEKRALLQPRLEKIGFTVLPAQGTYFLVADFRPLLPEGSEVDDVAFAEKLTTEAGVTVIPVSAFYCSWDSPKHLVRFCFCKSDEKLNTACDRLEQYFAS